MFTLKKDHSYKWPVTIEEPIDGGRFAKQTYTAIFKRVPQSEVEGLSDADLVRKVLAGWVDIIDDTKQQVEFSEEARDAMIEVDYFRIATVRAYVASNVGEAARRKN